MAVSTSMLLINIFLSPRLKKTRFVVMHDFCLWTKVFSFMNRQTIDKSPFFSMDRQTVALRIAESRLDCSHYNVKTHSSGLLRDDFEVVVT